MIFTKESASRWTALGRSIALSVVTTVAVVTVASSPAAAQNAHDRPFSIEDALSAPFPTELVAPASKGRLAWIFDDRGSRKSGSRNQSRMV